MSAEVTTHRMVRITLMNWYLFGSEDLEVDAASVMISGANGAGKSSIIDAIQTVLSGGNENALSMNAQSSNSQKSSRSIQSYALGIVDDQESGGGLAACRSDSNTYIALTFRRPDGSYYALGMGFYARSGDSKVKKLWFVTNGNSLSSVDFMDGSRVMTLNDFQRRLKAMDPSVMLAKNSKGFRYDYCQLMSQEGAGLQISPDPMWQAIKNGISYRGEKSISDFISSFILPAEELDINRLHNDYKEHERILALIEKTENEINSLNSLLNYYRLYETRMVDSICYGWVSAEASILAFDLRIEQAEEKIESLNEKLKKLTERQSEMTQEEPEINRKRDDARDLFKGSDTFQSIEKHEEAIRNAKARIDGSEVQLQTAKVSLARFLNTHCPVGLSEEFVSNYQELHTNLNTVADLSEDTLIPWPACELQGQKILTAISAYHKLQKELSEERDKAKDRNKTAEDNLKELQSTFKKLESGETPLSEPAERIVAILKAQGITALPVCELCSISDRGWQEGIERYLGRNREALVIQNGDYTLALKTYRRALHEDQSRASLRGVRLVNPDYDFGYEGKPKTGTAAELIVSDNEIALRFLRGLLWSVNLVNTEEELRREKRAITPDGMVAANGAISGGNSIRGIMIGVEARRQYASTMQTQLNEALGLYRDQKKEFDPIDRFNTSFLTELSNLNRDCLHIEAAYKAIQGDELAIQDLNQLLTDTRESSDNTLENAYKLADEALQRFNGEKTSLAVNISDMSKEVAEIKKDLPRVNSMVDHYSKKRSEFCDHQLFDPERANSHLEKLTELEIEKASISQKDNAYDEEIAVNDTVARTAQKRSENAEKNAQSAGEEALKGKVDFITRFEPANREELKDLDPFESRKAFEGHLIHLDNTELVTHRHDAENACSEMLTTFRADVVSILQDAFQRMQRTFKQLNDQLKDLPFNNNTYRFVYPVVETKTLKDVHDYVIEQSKADTEAVDSLFDFSEEHPAIPVIQEVLTEGRVDELSDYRNFFSYDIMAKDQSTGKERRFSNLLSTGSGGEQQSPFYIAFGASFMTAFKVQRRGDQVNAGAAIAIFDEAFSRMDGNNTYAALEFFSQIGLQAFLAAPLDAEVKMGHHVERVVTIIRDGLSVFTDSRQINDAGWDLLESDNPKRHPELIEALVPQARQQLNISEQVMQEVDVE